MGVNVNLDIVKAVSQIAGPAGLAMGVFLILMRDVIAKNIFPGLTKKHANGIIRILIFASWSIVVFAIFAWAYVSTNQSAQNSQAVSYPPLSSDSLKNQSYEVHGLTITLQDGRREFEASLSQDDDSYPLYVTLVEQAFGDLDLDGNIDAVAVLLAHTGGSGLYYHLTAAMNEKGFANILKPSFVLGDRLQFRSVFVEEGKIIVDVIMHGPDDGLCCPTDFRRLVFSINEGSLQCETNPCSELVSQADA